MYIDLYAYITLVNVLGVSVTHCSFISQFQNLAFQSQRKGKMKLCCMPQKMPQEIDEYTWYAWHIYHQWYIGWCWIVRAASRKSETTTGGSNNDMKLELVSQALVHGFKSQEKGHPPALGLSLILESTVWSPNPKITGGDVTISYFWCYL